MSKSIRSVLEKYAYYEYCLAEGIEFEGYTIDQALKDIAQIIDEAKPKKAYTGFNGSYVSGIDQYQSNLREALK